MKASAALSIFVTFAPLVSAGAELATRALLEARQSPDYGYSGDIAPDSWANLSPSYAACANDQSQSPIVLNSNTPRANRAGVSASLPNVASATLTNTGHNLQVTGPSGTLSRGGVTYNFNNFHFHTPSEHRINDEYFPMEIHFVFENPNQRTVVGYNVELATGSNTESTFITNVFRRVNSVRNRGQSTTTDALDFTPLQTLFQNNEVYNYWGSLTTPPCTENVNWLVVSRPLYISPANFLNLKSIMRFNSRTAYKVYVAPTNQPHYQ